MCKFKTISAMWIRNSSAVLKYAYYNHKKVIHFLRETLLSFECRSLINFLYLLARGVPVHFVLFRHAQNGQGCLPDVG